MPSALEDKVVSVGEETPRLDAIVLSSRRELHRRAGRRGRCAMSSRSRAPNGGRTQAGASRRAGLPVLRGMGTGGLGEDAMEADIFEAVEDHIPDEVVMPEGSQR